MGHRLEPLTTLLSSRESYTQRVERAFYLSSSIPLSLSLPAFLQYFVLLTPRPEGPKSARQGPLINLTREQEWIPPHYLNMLQEVAVLWPT
ncbi:hypothetical protein N431DRAFT_160967 [Stipitochalara longipes BDJ]|nr:hypothetical protein N431DRAFT_160967 [Stipitochalara longipes BDJ]